MKYLSIFIKPTFSSPSLEREEYPVPKSSREISIPESFNILSLSFITLKLSSRIDSVISSSSLPGSRSNLSIIPFTRSTKSSLNSWIPEIFTAIVVFLQISQSISLANFAAISRSLYPSGAIISLFSATSINSIGEILPSSAEFILANASKPDILPVLKSTFGW